MKIKLQLFVNGSYRSVDLPEFCSGVGVAAHARPHQSVYQVEQIDKIDVSCTSFSDPYISVYAQPVATDPNKIKFETPQPIAVGVSIDENNVEEIVEADVALIPSIVALASR